jgi:hypothetical protein
LTDTKGQVVVSLGTDDDQNGPVDPSRGRA